MLQLGGLFLQLMPGHQLYSWSIVSKFLALKETTTVTWHDWALDPINLVMLPHNTLGSCPLYGVL